MKRGFISLAILLVFLIKSTYAQMGIQVFIGAEMNQVALMNSAEFEFVHGEKVFSPKFGVRMYRNLSQKWNMSLELSFTRINVSSYFFQAWLPITKSRFDVYKSQIVVLRKFGNQLYGGIHSGMTYLTNYWYGDDDFKFEDKRPDYSMAGLHLGGRVGVESGNFYLEIGVSSLIFSQSQKSLKIRNWHGFALTLGYDIPFMD